MIQHDPVKDYKSLDDILKVAIDHEDFEPDHLGPPNEWFPDKSNWSLCNNQNSWMTLDPNIDFSSDDLHLKSKFMIALPDEALPQAISIDGLKCYVSDPYNHKVYLYHNYRFKGK